MVARSLAVLSILGSNKYLENQHLKVAIKKQVVDVRYQDERTYIFCEQSESHEKNHDVLSQLFLINNQRDDAFKNLVDLTDANEDSISSETVAAIKVLTSYNDGLFYAGQNVCQKKIKDPEELKIIGLEIKNILDKRNFFSQLVSDL